MADLRYFADGKPYIWFNNIVESNVLEGDTPNVSINLNAYIDSEGFVNLYMTGAYPGGIYMLKVWVDGSDTRAVIHTWVADSEGKGEYLNYPTSLSTGVPYSILNFAVYDQSDHRTSNIAKPVEQTNGGSTNGTKACLLTAMGVPFIILEFIRHFIRPILPLAVTKKYYSLSARILLPNS